MKSPIDMIKSDPNIAPAFRDALQLTFPRGDFAALTRTEAQDNAEVGRGLTCDIADYQSGGRFA